MVDQSQKEKRYKDYEKSQEAQITTTLVMMHNSLQKAPGTSHVFTQGE